MTVRANNRGLIYLRRSSSKQELSLAGQLAWAIDRARRDGVQVDAEPADLAYMQRSGLHHYKDILLDDAISGADMERPGFVALQSRASADRRVSDIFVHMRDRLGRPDNAMKMALIEQELRAQGIRFVFSNDIGAAGEMDFGEAIKLHVEYYQSGDFLVKLAERIVSGNRKIAGMGHWAGGKAPYGFKRVFVNAAGEVIQDLAPGQTMRQTGCHVQLRPADATKIGWWLFILEAADKGLGAKRIANHLNEIGVPSPDAGVARKVGGVSRIHGGKWSHTTVLDLLHNPAVRGFVRYARRSMGWFRRSGVDGPRKLSETDRASSGRPKVIRNPTELQVISPGGYASLIPPSLNWEELQQKIDARGRSQRGIPRASDPGKYPLSCRIIDMTNCCGATMYGRTSGERPIYVCGRYEKNGATACDNNTVDAEAMLALVLRFFQNFLGPDLEQRLRHVWATKFANQRPEDVRDLPSAEFAALSEEKKRLQLEMDQLRTNMRRVTSDKFLSDLQQDYDELDSRLTRIDQQLAKTTQRPPSNRLDPEQEIAAALKLLQNFGLVLNDPEARRALPAYFQSFGLQIGLNFKEGRKGPKRRVRVLAGGVLALSNGRLPIALHGRDRLDDASMDSAPEITASNETICDGGEDAVDNSEKNDLGVVREPHGVEASGTDVPGNYQSRVDSRSNEGISSTKVSRGDRI